MSEMPLKARLYWALVCLTGAGAVASSQAIGLPKGDYAPWEFLVFLAVALLAGGQKVNLNRFKKDEEAGSMCLGFAITFAALLRLGPSAAVVVALFACFSSCVYPHVQSWYQILFNLFLSAIEALVGGLIFLVLNHWTMQAARDVSFAEHAGGSIAAAAGASIGFFLVNTFGVATIIALYTDEPVYKTWRENFLWTAPSYFASASVGALALLISSPDAAIVLLFILPIAYFVYQSYRTYIERNEAKQATIEILQQKQAQLTELYLSTIRSLALAIDAKDPYTHEHILRVQRYAVAVAQEIGIEGDELEAVRTGSLLHDIGKLGIPESLLLKPERLTDEEFELIKKHPEIGAQILGPVEFPWPVLPIVRHHHEKWDGTGYPDGLKGEAIPLTARIMAVADVYDALTSTRSYRKAWSHERAIELILRDSGTHFDPRVVDVFMKVIEVVHEDAPHETDVEPIVAQQAVPGSTIELNLLDQVPA